MVRWQKFVGVASFTWVSIMSCDFKQIANAQDLHPVG